MLNTNQLIVYKISLSFVNISIYINYFKWSGKLFSCKISFVFVELPERLYKTHKLFLIKSIFRLLIFKISNIYL